MYDLVVPLSCLIFGCKVVVQVFSISRWLRTSLNSTDSTLCSWSGEFAKVERSSYLGVHIPLVQTLKQVSQPSLPPETPSNTIRPDFHPLFSIALPEGSCGPAFNILKPCLISSSCEHVIQVYIAGRYRLHMLHLSSHI